MRFDKLIYQAYCQGDPFQFDMCIEFLFGLLLHTCFSSTEGECLKYGGKNVFVGQCYVKSMSHHVPDFLISHPQKNRCKLNDNDHYSGLNVTLSYLSPFRLTGCGKTVWIIQ